MIATLTPQLLYVEETIDSCNDVKRLIDNIDWSAMPSDDSHQAQAAILRFAWWRQIALEGELGAASGEDTTNYSEEGSSPDTRDDSAIGRRMMSGNYRLTQATAYLFEEAKALREEPDHASTWLDGFIFDEDDDEEDTVERFFWFVARDAIDSVFCSFCRREATMSDENKSHGQCLYEDHESEMSEGKHCVHCHLRRR